MESVDTLSDLKTLEKLYYQDVINDALPRIKGPMKKQNIFTRINRYLGGHPKVQTSVK